MCYVTKVLEVERCRSKRRAYVLSLVGTTLVVQTLNLVFYLAPNILVLVDPCNLGHPLISWSGFVRYTCWNTIFLVFVIYGHNSNLYNNGDGFGRNGDAIVMDAPCSIHRPKLIVWFVMEGLIVAITARTRVGFPGVGAGDCDRNSCSLPTVVTYMTVGVFLVMLVYLGLYSYYIRQAYNHLKSLPYAPYRMGNISVRLQLRLQGAVFAFIVLSAALLWFVNSGSCSSFYLSWFGLLPLQFVASAMATLLCVLYHPIGENDHFTQEIWLQEFAWTEAEKPMKMSQRGGGKCIGRPMFCFETALKLYYFTELVYDFMQVDDSAFSLSTAMALYDLDHYELLHEKLHDTKVLVAWNNDTIVLSFRGTYSWANVLADLQIVRTAHPPVRGSILGRTRPLVHRGFLESWQTRGLDKKIIQKINMIIKERNAHKASGMRVLVTGHSLGGAVATLCAFEIAREFGSAKCSLECYPFGAPRTGNHAFAEEYNSAVPDTWHIINDQDYITRTLKLLLLYKRPGERVFINGNGDLIVKPSFVENSFHYGMFGTINLAHHMLGSYRKSLVEIVRAQFLGKGLHGGFDAMMSMLDSRGRSESLSVVLGLEKSALLRLQGWSRRVKRIEAQSKRKQKQEKRQRALKVVSDRAVHFAFSVVMGAASLAMRLRDTECQQMRKLGCSTTCGRGKVFKELEHASSGIMCGRLCGGSMPRKCSNAQNLSQDASSQTGIPLAEIVVNAASDIA